MTRLDKIRARIRALRSMTQAAGCTEAEALAAAEIAARLMAEAGLNEADLEMTSARAQEATVEATWRTRLSGAVGYVTNTAPILLPGSAEMEFVGRDPWPEVAAYLYAVLVGAVRREATAFKRSETYKRRRTVKTKRAAMADFTMAMVLRLRERLLELFAATLDADARASAQSALALRHPVSEAIAQKPLKPRFHAALAAGWAAGGNVTLTHGVGGDGRPLAIADRRK